MFHLIGFHLETISPALSEITSTWIFTLVTRSRKGFSITATFKIKLNRRDKLLLVPIRNLNEDALHKMYNMQMFFHHDEVFLSFE